MPLSRIATSTAAHTRGTTRRCTGEMPSTAIASISSRIVRAPRSAQIAEPAAPEIISAVTIGLACWMTASTLAAPVNDCAPICTVSEPSCSAITAPNGIATSAAGSTETLGDEPELLDQLAQLERALEGQPDDLEAEREQLPDLGEHPDDQAGSLIGHSAGCVGGAPGSSSRSSDRLTAAPPVRGQDATRALPREDHEAGSPQPNSKELRTAEQADTSRSDTIGLNRKCSASLDPRPKLLRQYGQDGQFVPPTQGRTVMSPTRSPRTPRTPRTQARPHVSSRPAAAAAPVAVKAAPAASPAPDLRLPRRWIDSVLPAELPQWRGRSSADSRRYPRVPPGDGRCADALDPRERRAGAVSFMTQFFRAGELSAESEEFFRDLGRLRRSRDGTTSRCRRRSASGRWWPGTASSWRPSVSRCRARRRAARRVDVRLRRPAGPAVGRGLRPGAGRGADGYARLRARLARMIVSQPSVSLQAITERGARRAGRCRSAWWCSTSTVSDARRWRVDAEALVDCEARRRGRPAGTGRSRPVRAASPDEGTPVGCTVPSPTRRSRCGGPGWPRRLREEGVLPGDAVTSATTTCRPAAARRAGDHRGARRAAARPAARAAARPPAEVRPAALRVARERRQPGRAGEATLQSTGRRCTTGSAGCRRCSVTSCRTGTPGWRSLLALRWALPRWERETGQAVQAPCLGGMAAARSRWAASGPRPPDALLQPDRIARAGDHAGQQRVEVVAAGAAADERRNGLSSVQRAAGEQVVAGVGTPSRSFIGTAV